MHAHLTRPQDVPQSGTSTIVLEAYQSAIAPFDQWRIRLKPQLGAQECTGDTGTEDTFVQFSSQADFNANGTTAKGKCTINVTSIAPKYEGTFTATLITSAGPVDVTDGSFRVTKN